MKKLIYIEEDFLSPSLCQPFIDLYDNSEDSFLKSVTHSNSNESLEKNPVIPEVEWRDHAAVYFGGDVDPVQLNLTKNELFVEVINKVTNLCKSFEPNANLDYVGVVRWPPGTHMKPHFDNNDVHTPDLFACMLYLNDNYEGGHTIFEHMNVEPKAGKLLIFSNAQYLHYVNEVKGADRFNLSFWYNHADLPS